jgi:hypothetical protein
MKRFLPLLVVVAMVGTARATPITIWMNDFDTLDGVTVRTPVIGPYLYDGGAWGDVPLDVTGYMVMDVEMCDLQAEQAYDMTYGDITITLQIEGDWLIPDETTGFWVRFYSRAWNGTEWVFSGAQNYAYDVEQTSELYGFGPGWQTFTRSVDDWNETNYWGPFYPDQVYKFRVDCVTWDPGLTPYRFGISYLDIVAPECPNDLDDDDDVDLADLAILLGEYGCNSYTITPVFDTNGFEDYDYGDLPGQDGFQDMSSDAHPGDPYVVIPPQVIDDPTGSGMGKVVEMDPPHDPDDYSGWSGFYRPLDAPATTGVFSIVWDQYRPDGGDNVWISDDPNWDGWWSIEWDSSGAGSISTYEWQEFIALTFNTWQHIQYKYDLDNDVVILVVDDIVKQVSYGDPDGIEGLYMDITDTFVEGDGPIYIDNLKIGTLNALDCDIDYDDDGDTDLADLAELLGEYGCGAP